MSRGRKHIVNDTAVSSTESSTTSSKGYSGLVWDRCQWLGFVNRMIAALEWDSPALANGYLAFIVRLPQRVSYRLFVRILTVKG